MDEYVGKIYQTVPLVFVHFMQVMLCINKKGKDALVDLICRPLLL